MFHSVECFTQTNKLCPLRKVVVSMNSTLMVVVGKPNTALFLFFWWSPVDPFFFQSFIRCNRTRLPLRSAYLSLCSPSVSFTLVRHGKWEHPRVFFVASHVEQKHNRIQAGLSELHTQVIFGSWMVLGSFMTRTTTKTLKL